MPVINLILQQPEKENPDLTPMDWLKFLVSAAIGLVSYEHHICSFIYMELSQIFLYPLLLSVLQVTVISSLRIPKADIRVIFGILSAVGCYCVKTYLSLSVFFFFFLLIPIVVVVFRDIVWFSFTFSN